MSTTLQTTNGKPKVEDQNAMLGRLKGLTVAELRSRLDSLVVQTAEGLQEMAVCIRALEEAGDDISDLHQWELFRYLRRVAWGQLVPEAILTFVGSPLLMQKVARLPIPDQRRLSSGEGVELVVRRGDGFDKRIKSPLAMTPDQVRQAFGPDSLRSESEQIARLEARLEPVAENGFAPHRPAKIKTDPKAATLKVGRHDLPVKDVLAALGNLAPIDHDTAGPGKSVTIDAGLFASMKRIAAAGDATVRHVVEVAIRQKYFPGEGAE